MHGLNIFIGWVAMIVGVAFAMAETLGKPGDDNSQCRHAKRLAAATAFGLGMLGVLYGVAGFGLLAVPAWLEIVGRATLLAATVLTPTIFLIAARKRPPTWIVASNGILLILALATQAVGWLRVLLNE